ncbi:MAG: DUF5685 family protein [Candidatus Aphodomorpha sp.]
MFGFVVANQEVLEPDRLRRYRAFYCGLCRALGSRYGLAARCSLTYDMTFLVMLLSSLYEPEEQSAQMRCVPHPLRAHECTQTDYTAYAAGLNVMLAYYNCEDDWQDEHRMDRHAEALLLKRHLPALRRAYPRQSAAIEQNLKALQQAEREHADVDTLANLFADLMGELFVPDENDHWADTLRHFGAALGRFIYVLDACLDADADKKRGAYNPLLAFQAEADFDKRCQDMLTLLIGEAAIAFETLPLVQDADILRNILYSGVWTRFSLLQRKRQKEQERT